MSRITPARVANAILATFPWDSRLYRAHHGTFEEYCRARWGFARSTAYQYIDAAEAVENVRNCGQGEPTNEAQVRPLTRLPAEQQREAWQQAVETAPRGEKGAPKVTAAHVEETVREIEGRPKMAVHYTSDSPEWYTPRHMGSRGPRTTGRWARWARRFASPPSLSHVPGGPPTDPRSGSF